MEIDKVLVRWRDEYGFEVPILKTRLQEIKNSLPKEESDDVWTRKAMLKLHADLSRTKMGDKHEGFIIGDTGKENYIERTRGFAKWQYGEDKDLAVSKRITSYDGTPLYTGKGKYNGTPLDKLPKEVLDNAWTRTIFVNEKGTILPVKLWRKDVDGEYPVFNKIEFSATQKIDNAGNVTNLNLRSGTIKLGDPISPEEAFRLIALLAFKDFEENKVALIEGYVVEIEEREDTVLVYLNDPLLEHDSTVTVGFPISISVNAAKDQVVRVLGRLYKSKKSGKWGINGYSIFSDTPPTPVTPVPKEAYGLQDDSSDIDADIAEVLKD